MSASTDRCSLDEAEALAIGFRALNALSLRWIERSGFVGARDEAAVMTAGREADALDAVGEAR